MPVGRPRSKPHPSDRRAKNSTSILIKEGLRRKLKAAAIKNGDSLNAEIMKRLERSFETPAMQAAE